MQYRTLGSTGLKVSVVGVGTWQFGGEWGVDYEQPQVDAIIDTALEEGINLIDTAECYGDHLSESLIGNRIRKDRDKWIVATKFGHKFHAFLDRTHDYSADGALKQLDESLQALQTDYVDLYQFHSGPDEDYFNDELWEALSRQKEAGKIRHLGLSVSGGESIEKQIAKAKDYNIEAIQIIYNRLNRRPEEGAFDTCRQDNLGVLARVPLASGFLTGKYKAGDSFPDNDVRGKRSQENIDKTLKEVEKIKQEEVPDGVPMVQWALAWCLRDEVVTTVIPGCKNPDQVRSNAAAAELKID
ncbi:MAG: aldo/keto reductase [Candidatus Sumerlaeia bacterium]